jgi:hypothetical protein
MTETTRQKMSIAKKGKKHPNWKGGIRIDRGYRYVLLSPEHPFYAMANKRGYVQEHRLVMAQHLGRLLEPYEVVHHINGDRGDNRIENLKLIESNAEHYIGEGHISDAHLMSYLHRLEQKNIQLEHKLNALTMLFILSGRE